MELNENYKPDRFRGKWESELNFYLASVGHAFGVQNFCLLAIFKLTNGGIFSILFISFAFLFVIPIYFVQSSIGQFSGTGFISAFRVSPLFKGVGYTILILNILSASYYTILASYPLWYFFMSFSSEFPWMSCPPRNFQNCTSHDLNYTSTTEYFNHVRKYNKDSGTIDIAWPLVGSSLIVWIFGYICLRDGMKSIGPIIRFTTAIPLTILMIIFFRILFLPSGIQALGTFFSFDYEIFEKIELYLFASLYAFISLGSGWGTIIVMSSFNEFKVDTIRYSIVIPLTVYGVTVISGFITHAIREYLSIELNYVIHVRDNNSLDMLYDAFALFVGSIESPHLWAVMLYLLLFLCEMNTLIIQVFAVLTTIFDEYEILRNYKNILTLGTCIGIFFSSIFYANNIGYEIYSIQISFSSLTQLLICFFELIIIFWIYGRIKFQRDVEFMLGRKIKTWTFNVMKFVTPFFTLIIMVIFFYYFIDKITKMNVELWYLYVGILLKTLSFLFIPGYVAYKIYITKGAISNRIRICLNPKDWYPSAPKYHEKYVKTFRVPQLVEMNILDQINS